MENKELAGIFDIIIVGAGPAGLTAGLYAVRTGRKVLLLEHLGAGGQAALTWKIDNYPAVPHVNGLELISKFEKQVNDLGLKIQLSTLVSIIPGSPHILRTSEGDFKTKTVVIALGAKPKNLGIPGEDKYRGKGVSYCATCDGAFFKNKIVAVIGGGNTALEEAEFLTRFASKVYIVHRREQFRADQIIQNEVLKNTKIQTVMPYIPQEILGDGNNISALRIVQRGQNACRDLEVNGVFIFTGWEPQTSPVNTILRCNDEGYILTDQNFMTNIPGIFAAGDCRANQVKQIIVAAGEGASAAVMADRYITTL